jgi:DNA/RNA endonuclease YhcR with UshA esterase domain
MIRRFRSVGLCLAVAALAGCSDSGLGPDGTPSPVAIRVYVDTDASGTFTASDRPVQGATVALSENGGSSSFQATTGADGVATLDAVPTGSYTASITDTGDLPAGAVLSSVRSVTVRTGPSGSEVSGEFRYSFLPGTISGRVYRDDDASGAFESGKDTPAPAFEIRLYAGADTTGAAVDSTRTDDAGLFTFDLLQPGSYTVLVRTPSSGVAITGGAIRSVTVAGDQAQTLDLKFTGALLVSIADASSRTTGSSVVVRGVVTGGTTAFGTSIYLQDPTGGIQVFLGSGNSTSYSVGDSLQVSGTLSAFRGQLQIASPSISVLGTGKVPSPRTVTFAEVNARTYEGQLARATGKVSSVSGGPTSTAYNVTLKDPAGDSIIVRVGSAGVGIPQTDWVVGTSYTVTGLLGSFNGLAELFPRSKDDVAGPITIAKVKASADGTSVTTIGVVTAGTTSLGNAFYFQDSTDGVQVFFGSGAVTAVAPGDSVLVVGVLTTFRGEKEITAPTVTILKQVTPPAARVVTGAQIAAGTFEGQLVKVPGVTVTSVGSGSAYNVNVTAADGTVFTVRVPGAGAAIPASTFTVGSKYDITGVLGEFTTTTFTPQLKPRSLADITALP